MSNAAIAGLVSEMPAQAAQVQVRAMLRGMTHEPFHSAKILWLPEIRACIGWVDRNADRPHPPIEHRHGAKTLIFAGEHFGDSESTTQRRYGIDAAALLEAYERTGEACLRELNGWFAGIIVDSDRRQLVVFNDRLGLQRVYYAERRDGVAFASEAKALLAIRPESRQLDPEALAQFLAVGCVFGEGKTLFHGVHLLPAGSVLTIREPADSRVSRYFSPQELESQSSLSDDAYYECLKGTLKRVVPKYFSGGLPAAVSLTGGLDSRSIMACAGRLEHAKAYTYGGLYRDCYDVDIAAKVARACHFEHQVLRLTPDFLTQFPQLAEKTVWNTDGTADISVSHELYLSRLARAAAPVRVTGNFGSEIFRGVTTFKPTRLATQWFVPEFHGALAAAADSFAATKAQHPTTFAVFQEVPTSLYGRLAAAGSLLTVRSPFTDNALVALAYRTPPGQRNVSGDWVRLIHECAPHLAAIPTDRKLLGPASTLRRRAERLFNDVLFKAEWYYDAGMPHSAAALDAHLFRGRAPSFFVGSHKIQHYRLWYRDHVVDYLESLFSDGRSRTRPYVDARACSNLVRDHVTGRRNNTTAISVLATVELVYRLFIERPYPAAITQNESQTCLT